MTANDAINRIICSMDKRYADFIPSSYDVEIMGYQFASYEVIKVTKLITDDMWSLTEKGEKMYAQMMCVKTKKIKSKSL